MGATEPNHVESTSIGLSQPPGPDAVAPLGDDVLLGARRIAEHLAAILGAPISESDVYYAHRAKKLPLGKFGAALIASRATLNHHIEKLARGRTAA